MKFGMYAAVRDRDMAHINIMGPWSGVGKPWQSNSHVQNNIHGRKTGVLIRIRPSGTPVIYRLPIAPRMAVIET